MTEIKADIIIEMLGRPAAHLKKVMEEFLKKLGTEKGISIIKRKIHTPKKYKQKDKEGNVIEIPKEQEFYSTFADVEIETKEIFDLIRIVFAYMPSHVEVISPNEFKLENFDLSAVLNEITKKMHSYDAIAKNAILENRALANRLMQMQQIMQGQQTTQGQGQQAMQGKQKSAKKKKKR